jgi:AraC-like DNA-binding protein
MGTMNNKINIKNMVCPRCIDAVKEMFDEMKVEVTSIQLGEVLLTESLSKTQKSELSEKLSFKGFELLEDKNAKLISSIKTIIVEQIFHKEETLSVNFSELLSEKLSCEYSSLSRLFSSTEGVTIEKYILKQKIERVKELIFYKEQTLSEIAYSVGYSSVAHLSTQFKKETGMSPSEFKKLKDSNRNALDSI